MIATTPKPPYYAVIFTNTLSENTAGYEEMANRMVELAEQQLGRDKWYNAFTTRIAKVEREYSL